MGHSMLPDWWRAPAVTGERTEFCVYSPGEQTYCVYEIKLLYVHPKEYPETELYLILLLRQVIYIYIYIYDSKGSEVDQTHRRKCG